MNVQIESPLDHRNPPVDRWQSGYQTFSLSTLVADLGLGCDLQSLKDVYHHLPQDPYDQSKRRRRCLGRAMYFPWTHGFEWVPDLIEADGTASAYYDQSHHNPEHTNAIRWLPGFPSGLRENRVLSLVMNTALLRVDWSPLQRHQAMGVRVHLIRQSVDLEHTVSAVSPNCMHQDGDTYDFVLLIDRRGTTGGENCIAVPEAVGLPVSDVPSSQVLERFTLTEELNGFAVKDDRVSHGVTPVHLAKEARVGHRDTLLVDITPLVENIR